MVSLAYYLRVIAAMWMQDAPEAAGEPAMLSSTGRPALAGGSPEADQPRPARQPEAWIVAMLFGGATLVFGIVPSPLFDLAVDAGRAFPGLF